MEHDTALLLTHSVIHELASLGELFQLPGLHIQVDRAVNECPKKYEAVIGDEYTPIIIDVSM